MIKPIYEILFWIVFIMMIPFAVVTVVLDEAQERLGDRAFSRTCKLRKKED
jgi:hypothetical protein